MDWDNPMAVFGFEDEEPQEQNGEVYDEHEHDDFYRDDNPKDDAHPGASEPANLIQQNNATTTATLPHITPDQKEKNQKTLDMLRSKLMAQRQNTPSKAVSRSGTPAQNNSQPADASRAAAVSTQPNAQPQIDTAIKEEVKANNEPSSDANGVEALLNEGKARADAKIAALAAAKNAQASKPAAANANGEAKHQKQQQTAPAQENSPAPAKQRDEHPSRPTNLSHAYYADLPAWLEITGYHNVAWREAKLSAYKERKALEEEAARIAERLEKLKQAEQEAMQSLRMSTPKPAAANMAQPPLPATMPTEKANPTANGINGAKRAHSPASHPPEKIQRRDDDAGFRIRGANDSPTDARPPGFRRPRTPSPPGLERRIAYPDARRRSIDQRKQGAPKSRDPSLERRQSYYQRDGDSYYDSYTPREPPRAGYNGPNRNNSISRAPQYRGSVPLDLRKGGVRYFIIKSWNHENVLTAQRENLWATQEKNEEILAEAYNTSRHVILLFSVNKSMAFQGYALMTSPPDGSLPKPAFATKLKWDTSAAFELRWLSTTPIHFKLVGHIKNTLNRDEQGEPRAVLVGKDGQEVSPDAGMGVVWIMDEAEIVEKEKGGGR